MLLNGMEKCNCIKTDCHRHGDCDACLSHHNDKNPRNPLPYCKRNIESKAKKEAK